VPQGDFVATLQTTWVEPAYLEPDAAWCQPGETPHGPAGNGGAFGAKATSMVADAARQLADALGRPVLAMLTREDIVHFGPKRPPIGAGVRADGHVVIRAARTAGLAATFGDDPTVTLVEVDVVGPPTSASIRAAGWAEIAVLRSRLADPTKPITIASPSGGVASASIDIVDGREVIDVAVSCGDVLDERTLRSYCIGAAHMALGWVRHEAIAVDNNGEPVDLTMRSFGILRAADMPPVAVHVVDAAGPAVNASDAVFAAVAAAAWRLAGWPPRWPTMRR
jgi:CO/xanthine dehydrogenase Mo-binding subunit